MKTLIRLLVFLVGALALQGCDLIEYHPYDARFSGAEDINARNVARIEAAMQGRRAMRFAVISDTQRWYDETRAAVNSINSRGDIDFVIHCGDLTDFSATDEFEWMRDELERLNPPYVCNIGNHDCLATGYNVFSAMYGDPNFSFTAGDTHFVCLNTNALEFDYSVPIPNLAFLASDIAAVDPDVRRTVAAMHAAPFTDQFNNNVANIFEEQLLRYPGLQLALCGHQHSTCVFYPYDDGIPYYECGAAKARQYLVFTLTEEGGVDYEVVDY